MRTLIGMTEFVLEQDKLNHSIRFFSDVVVKYANFLKQPLQLGFFIPCDLDGNILAEPKPLGCHEDADEYEWDAKEVAKYQQARERVLFEGAEAQQVTGFISFDLNGQYRGSFGNFMEAYLKNENTIEGLARLNEEIQLTEYAIKQIF